MQPQENPARILLGLQGGSTEGFLLQNLYCLECILFQSMFSFQYPLPLAVSSDTPAIATTTQSQRATPRTEPPMDSYDSKPRMISKTEDKKDTGQMTNKSSPEISMKKSEATRKTNQERKLARSKNSDDMDMASSAHKLFGTTWIFIFTWIMLL